MKKRIRRTRKKMRSRKRIKRRGGKRKRSKKKSLNRKRSNRVYRYIRKNRKKSACNNKKRKAAYIKRYKKKSKRHRNVQLGCSKQRGGNYGCEYPSNMGQIMTGRPLNTLSHDLIPQTTQSRHPSSQQGGGFDGLGTSKLIDFGGSGLLTATRGGINSLFNLKQVWNADRRIESSDPIDKSDRMDNN